MTDTKLNQCRAGRNATNTMLLWNPRTGDVLLKGYPERDGEHRGYRSGLACYSAIARAGCARDMPGLADVCRYLGEPVSGPF